MTWKRQSPTIKIKKKKIPAVYCIVLFFVGLKKKKKKSTEAKRNQAIARMVKEQLYYGKELKLQDTN